MRKATRGGFYTNNTGWAGTGTKRPRRNCACGSGDMSAAIDKMLAGDDSGLDPSLQAYIEKRIEAELRKQTDGEMGAPEPVHHSAVSRAMPGSRGALDTTRSDRVKARTASGPLRPRGVLA